MAIGQGAACGDVVLSSFPCGRLPHVQIWGPLAESRVVARPVVRFWPLDRFGAIETSVDLNPFRRSALRFRQALEEAILVRRSARE